MFSGESLWERSSRAPGFETQDTVLGTKASCHGRTAASLPVRMRESPLEPFQASSVLSYTRTSVGYSAGGRKAVPVRVASLRVANRESREEDLPEQSASLVVATDRHMTLSKNSTISCARDRTKKSS